MNTKLDKEFENIGFILDKSQFDSYQKIYETCSFEECILNCIFHGFEQIDFSKKDYLKSELYKPGNILLIPYKSKDCIKRLVPWQILNIDNGTMLHCKRILFQDAFDKNNSNIWKNSSLRKLLNSNSFLKRFPKPIRNNISFHNIWTNRKKTLDRFWLLSWQDLGDLGNLAANLTVKDNFFKYKIDYPSKKILFNTDVFKVNNDILKRFDDPRYNDHGNFWFLRSVVAYSPHEVAGVNNFDAGTGNGYLYCVTTRVNVHGCSPVFILD